MHFKGLQRSKICGNTQPNMFNQASKIADSICKGPEDNQNRSDNDLSIMRPDQTEPKRDRTAAA